MSNWKITFERSNKTTGNDTFTANTVQEAKHDFFECYRHDTYKILSVEEIKEVVTESETRTYRAEFADDEIEVFTAESDSQAITEAYKMEKEHGNVWNIILLDDNYNEVKTIF